MALYKMNRSGRAVMVRTTLTKALAPLYATFKKTKGKKPTALQVGHVVLKFWQK